MYLNNASTHDHTVYGFGDFGNQIDVNNCSVNGDNNCYEENVSAILAGSLNS